ncbi:MAG: hypothetical protein NTV21_14485 [Planctomycetota bacterium]|nr:hypothetical protein [Planctomycetota bacterium]
MSTNLVTSQPASPALHQLAIASMSSSPAATSLGAIEQAHRYFSGLYAELWKPAKNAALAWGVVLADATPEEISAAAIAWTQDTNSRDDRGNLLSKFPPKPVELLAHVRRQRAAADRVRREKEEQLARARRWVEDLEHARERGTLETMGARERRMLETNAAEAARFLDAHERGRAAGPRPIEPRPAQGKPASQRGGACGPLSTVVAVVMLGLLFGLWAGRFDGVRDARDAAVEGVVATARSAASQWCPDGRTTVILAAITKD